MESAFSDILFFFFIPSSLPCLALFALLSASFLFTLELKRAILRLVREMMAVLFSMVKGVEFQSQFDRASRRRKDHRRDGCARRCNMVYESCGYVQTERKQARVVDH